MSTVIVHNPKGDRANAITKWGIHHQDLLADKQTRVLDVWNPSAEKTIMTVEALKQKKLSNTLQEEHRWLRVVVPEPDIDKVNAYIGSNCGKRTNVPVGKAYACNTCSKKDTVSTPRITFSCEISDGTGTLAITTFTQDSETLFRMPAPDLFRIKHSGNKDAFESIKEMLRTKHVLVEVAPTTALSRNFSLKWSLKSVTLEEERLPVLRIQSKSKDKQPALLDEDQAALAATDSLLKLQNSPSQIYDDE